MNQDDLNQQLIAAAERGDAGKVLSLLDRGADVHAQNDLALRWAAENGRTEMVALLLDRGADVHARNDYALRWAANNGRTEVVALLLDRGADVHAEDDRALRWAALEGRTEVVALLLAHPTFTVPGLRAVVARYREDGWRDTDAMLMIAARVDVLTAEYLEKRAGESGFSRTPTQPDGGLGL